MYLYLVFFCASQVTKAQRDSAQTVYGQKHFSGYDTCYVLLRDDAKYSLFFCVLQVIMDTMRVQTCQSLDDVD